MKSKLPDQSPDQSMSKKTANKEADIPTLTEIVATASPPANPDNIRADAPSAPEPDSNSDTPSADASHKAIERLIYKVLYRHLPQLSQEISAEILQTLQKQPTRKKSKK
jgi:hypothetical protein